MHGSQVQTDNLPLAAYLLGQGLREIIHSAVHDVPQQARSPEFLDALVAMAMSCVKRNKARHRGRASSGLAMSIGYARSRRSRSAQSLPARPM
jgi:hypothetical protein